MVVVPAATGVIVPVVEFVPVIVATPKFEEVHVPVVAGVPEPVNVEVPVAHIVNEPVIVGAGVTVNVTVLEQPLISV
jgi:hypothetical protein